MMKMLQRYLEWRKQKQLGNLELRVLTSYELLCARAEAGHGEQAGLLFNCSVLAKAVQHRRKPVFASAKQVMQHLSVEQVEVLIGQYRDLCREQDLLGASLYEISKALRPIDRLRYRVLREFGVLPTSRQARDMTDGDVLFCAAAMEDGSEGVNPNFDTKRFEELR